jgi:peptidoglycan/LPS O-acetylase OafA/YrhL
MSSNLHGVKDINLREWLFWAAMVFAVGEFIDAFNTIEVIGGIIFSLMVAVCAFWLRRRSGRAPVIILLVLAAFELASVIFIYPNSSPPPAFWRLAIFALITTSVVILAVLALIRAEKVPAPDNREKPS